MLTINTNLSSLIAQNSMKTSTNKLNQAIERMTTGFKINHAKDNAANYAIANNMSAEISSLDIAEDNISQGIDLVNTADEMLSEINDRITRLRNLQEQAKNGTYGEESLRAINAECNALVDEIERLQQTAEYNGIKLFIDTEEDENGNTYYEQETFADESTTFEQLGLSATSFSVYSQDGNLIQTYDVAETDTLDDFFTTLTLEGFNANINSGQITLSSNDGKYIAGDLADSLGITTKQVSYIESTEQSFNNQVTVVDSTTNTTTVPVTTTIETTTTTPIELTITVYNAQSDPLFVAESVNPDIMTYAVTPADDTLNLFMQDIVRRDTTTMTALGSVDSSADLADGTYKISTTAELVQLAEMTNAGLVSEGDEFVLANNIDLSSIDNWTPIGDQREIITPTETVRARFTGVFDGNGYLVENLKVYDSDYAGLFGVANAVFKNVGVTNVNIEHTSCGGALVAWGDNSTITNCFSTGIVSGKSGMGGLAFCVDKVEYSYSTADVVYKEIESAVIKYGTGGLVGWVGSEINNCYATGDVSAKIDPVGGLVGYAHGNITNSYTTGNVVNYNTSTSGLSLRFNLSGGLVGDLQDDTIIENCYATGNISAAGNAGGLIGNATDTVEIINSFATGSVTGGENTGGLIGASDDVITAISSYSTQADLYATQKTEAEILDKANLTAMGFTEANGWKIVDGQPSLNWVEVEASTDSTLDQLGVVSSYIYLTDGSRIGYNFTSTSTINDILYQINSYGKGLNAQLTNGVLTIVGSNNIGIDYTTGSDNLFSAISIVQTETENIVSTTTVETTRTEQVYDETITETVFTTNTVSLTNSTEFNELGIDTQMLVTVYSDGTKGFVTIRGDTTLDEFYSELLTRGITASSSGGVTTFSGNGNSYIDSANLTSLLGLSAVNKTNGIKTSNTDSERQYAKERIYGIYAPGQVSLQAGINADSQSQIVVDVSFSLPGINNLREIGQDLTTDYLSILDEMLTEISQKQTQYGACINRLESALDEIEIRRDNLISSRSTIRDADIAEVSSHYIQQQILQQASATLLATANQSPSIALQLI